MRSSGQTKAPRPNVEREHVSLLCDQFQWCSEFDKDSVVARRTITTTVLLSFDFKRKQVRWVVRHPRVQKSLVVYHIQLQSVEPPFVIFSDEEERFVLMMRMKCLPQVYLVSQDLMDSYLAKMLLRIGATQINQEGEGPIESELATMDSAESPGTICPRSPSELIEIAWDDKDQNRRRVAPLILRLDGIELDPRHECDRVAFRFENVSFNLNRGILIQRLSQEGLLPTVRNGRQRAISRPIRRTKGTSLDEFVRNFHLRLPFEIRWCLNVMLTQNWLSSTSYVRILLPLLRDDLKVLGVGSVRYILERMSGYNYEDEEEGDSTSFRKIWSSQLGSRYMKYRKLARSRAGLESTLDADDESDRFFWVPSIIVTPSNVYCDGPFLESTNRMRRHFRDRLPIGALARGKRPSNQVWRLLARSLIACIIASSRLVSFREENWDTLFASDGRSNHLMDYLNAVLEKGIKLWGEQFDFLMFSQSQLRE